MIKVGEYNKLTAARMLDHGWYLTDDVENSVLLPMKWVPINIEEGVEIEVFIYRDSEDRLIATTMTPLLLAGQFAKVQVKDVTRIGAFVEMGVEKDLLVPFAEQMKDLDVGDECVIHMFLDNVTDRLTGSTKIEKFLKTFDIPYEEGEKVNALVYKYTDIGFKVIIENEYLGMIYHNQIFDPITVGDTLQVYVNKLREDGKIDLLIQKPGHLSIGDSTENVLQYLKDNDGFTPINDKTAPEVIYDIFKMSKKQYKKAIGGLYKEKLIKITEEGIFLINKR
ncbi:S1-like domain-containing RNA-binding protein [Flavobacteriales bacterium]|nr:S1-like domain-containing RNA-binding protein [Flavobacteriales bacterium]